MLGYLRSYCFSPQRNQKEAVTSTTVKIQLWVFPVLLLMAVARVGLSVAPEENSWDEDKPKKDISVYHRAVEGTHRKDVKAVTALKVPKEKVMAALRATELSSEWMYALETSEIFETTEEGHTVYYFYWNVLPPFPDHDTYLIREEEPGPSPEITIFRHTYYDGGYPKKDGLSRMDTFGCLWEIEALGPEATKIALTLQANPSGTIPAWFVNYMTTLNATESLEGLKKFILEERYQKAQAG